MGAAGWKDANNDLWLYGGHNEQGFTVQGYFSDVWRYNIASNKWTWISGANTLATVPVYGTMGVAAAANTPGGRDQASTWVDGVGNFYLFGGNVNGLGVANDMWKYNPSTNQWTWLKGSNTLNNLGSYGTLGLEASSNLPPARTSYCHEKDAAGNFYLFGGSGYNDVWKYNPTTNNWTWVNGPTTADTGLYINYCQLGRPSGRNGYCTAPASGNGNKCGFYVFGGTDTTNTCNNDLWFFDTDTYQWKWLSGIYNDTANIHGNFGTLNVPAASNRPPGKQGASLFTTTDNKMWMFGGFDCNLDFKNYVWTYVPDTACTGAGECIYNSVDDIENRKHHDIIISPNPVIDELIINNNEIPLIAVSVYDILGRMKNQQIVYDTSTVAHSQSIKLTISNLPAAIYFLKAIDKNGNMQTAKFVKVGK